MICPHCGKVINGIGRKKQYKGVPNVRNALRDCYTVRQAVEKAGCSVRMFYDTCRDLNIEPLAVIKENVRRRYKRMVKGLKSERKEVR